MNKYGRTELEQLILNMEVAMEEYWDALANCESPDDSVYCIANEIEALGIGHIYIPTMQGNKRWFSLEDMSF